MPVNFDGHLWGQRGHLRAQERLQFCREAGAVVAALVLFGKYQMRSAISAPKTD
jgi:hypothetical protein